MNNNDAGEISEEHEQLAPAASHTLLRALDVLEAVAQEPLALAELTARLGLTRSTTYRVASALAARRYLKQNRGQGYQLGPKLLELGWIAQDRADVLTIAKPLLEDLTRATGLPAFIGVRDGHCSVNLFSSAGRQRVAVIDPVGSRRRLAETSLGKALILDDTEDEWQQHLSVADPTYVSSAWLTAMQQYASEELVVHAGPPPDHVRSLAAPVRDKSARIVAAISIVTIVQYMGVEEIARFAPQLRAAAEKISIGLGRPAGHPGDLPPR